MARKKAALLVPVTEGAVLVATSDRLRLGNLHHIKRELRRIYIDGRNGRMAPDEVRTSVYTLGLLRDVMKDIADSEVADRLAAIERALGINQPVGGDGG